MGGFGTSKAPRIAVWPSLSGRFGPNVWRLRPDQQSTAKVTAVTAPPEGHGQFCVLWRLHPRPALHDTCLCASIASPGMWGARYVAH